MAWRARGLMAIAYTGSGFIRSLALLPIALISASLRVVSLRAISLRAVSLGLAVRAGVLTGIRKEPARGRFVGNVYLWRCQPNLGEAALQSG